MRLLYFLIFSSLEFSATITLILSLFMFQIRTYIPHIFFTSITLAQASYLLNDVLHYPEIAPLLQLIIFILCLWLLFRTQIFYAAMMTVVGYIAYVLIQLLIVSVVDWLNIISVNEAMLNKNVGYTLQFITSVAVFIICALFKGYRLGFSFVPDSERQRIKLKGENIYFLVIMFVATIMISVAYLFTVNGMKDIMIVILALALILCILLYLAMRKEQNS